MTITEIIVWFLRFLNDTGLTTILVGGSAIYLYLKQKKDYKRDAAALIIQEIRYAEQQIREAKKHDYEYYLADKLLPTNSWHNNIHLFVTDLKESELDLISRFYAHSSYLDTVIEKISNKKNDMVISRKQPVPGAQIVPENNQQFDLGATNILKEVSEKIEFIYNTPAVDRLRSISEKKLYQLF